MTQVHCPHPPAPPVHPLFVLWNLCSLLHRFRGRTGKGPNNMRRQERIQGNNRMQQLHQRITEGYIPLQKDSNIPVHRPKRHRLPPSQQRETQSSYFGSSQQRETQSSYFGSTKASTKPGATTSEVSRPKAEDNRPKHHPEAIDRPRRGSKPRNFLIPSMEAASK